MAEILVIAPHPDDEVLGCGGTMARHADNGDRVHVVVVTRGTPDLFPPEGIDALRKEAEQAHQLLGVVDCQYLDFPAPKMDQVAGYAVADKLRKTLLEVRPEIVYPPRRHRWRWRSVPIHERWLETLLAPDLELRGKDAEVLQLCSQIDAWRDAIFPSRPEYECEETPISLPPKGEDFWVGRQLPVDFLGPVEAPPNPALVLSRVGELPGWQGAAPLRASLKPVYEAASRYAREHVFGRK
jgi:hypothetical protein